MTNPRHPLRLNVGFLISSSIGINREFPFEFDHLESEDLSLNQFNGIAKISRTPQGLLIQANFQAETALECVRCLKEFDHLLKWEFTELYAFDRKSMTDSELLISDDGHIDLEDLVREFAILEIPITPLCKKDCKGLCAECGQDLNETDCGHRPENNSPFSVLKDLLDS